MRKFTRKDIDRIISQRQQGVDPRIIRQRESAIEMERRFPTQPEWQYNAGEIGDIISPNPTISEIQTMTAPVSTQGHRSQFSGTPGRLTVYQPSRALPPTGLTPKRKPTIIEQYEPKFRIINKTNAKDMR